MNALPERLSMSSLSWQIADMITRRAVQQNRDSKVQQKLRDSFNRWGLCTSKYQLDKLDIDSIVYHRLINAESAIEFEAGLEYLLHE